MQCMQRGENVEEPEGSEEIDVAIVWGGQLCPCSTVLYCSVCVCVCV